MISDEELDAIEKRCNKAAEGPWEYCGGGIRKLPGKEVITYTMGLASRNGVFIHRDNF